VKVTIIGAGAIGGVTGAYMARDGVEVTLVDQADDHVDAIRRDGLRIEGLDDFTIDIPVLRPSELRGPLEMVIVAVKTQHTAAALDAIEPHLKAASVVMPLQNGLSADWIAERVGAERTVPTSITTNQFYISPGKLRYNVRGVVHVGESDGRITPRVEQIVELLAHAYDAHPTDNVWGWIWSKMVAGSITFTTALVDAPMGTILTASDRHRRMFGRIAAETGAVARARGVRLEPTDDIDPNAMLPGADDAMLMREVDRYAARCMDVYSGVWRDIAVRKRRTEADTLIGPLIDEGARLSVPMPLNRAMRRLLKEVEDGQRGQSWNHIDELIAISEGELAPTPA
jgi:2-dehydropantoate 2-reductase